VTAQTATDGAFNLPGYLGTTGIELTGHKKESPSPFVEGFPFCGLNQRDFGRGEVVKRVHELVNLAVGGGAGSVA